MADALGGYRPVIHIFEKARFTCKISLAESRLCLYLEPFRSYLALKLTLLEKIFKNSTYLAVWRRPRKSTAPCR